MNIEIFKTDVQDKREAEAIALSLYNTFGYTVNFDLDDCDRIMRIKSREQIDALNIINFLNRLGYTTAVLPDEISESNKSVNPPAFFCYKSLSANHHAFHN